MGVTRGQLRDEQLLDVVDTWSALREESARLVDQEEVSFFVQYLEHIATQTNSAKK
jgi:hypothetical protein